MHRFFTYFLLLVLSASTLPGQEIRLINRSSPEKIRSVRLDKPVLIRTFDGEKIKGLVSGLDEHRIIIEGKEAISLEEIMSISGYPDRNSGDRALGIGFTIGAGILLPAALYYILGGIAWGMPNGIFVGATILAIDLFLAYTGASFLGLYPRRFSTMNWQVVLPTPGEDETPSLPLPVPNG